MIITTSSSSAFTPAPAGSFLARCCRVVDLGTQKTEFQGETKQQHKVLVVFEILDPDVFREDGKPYTVAKRYSASMHEKAALRRDLESWRGAKFTDADLKHFDLASILGRTCLLSVTHTDKAGSIFANIAAVVKAPKGMTGTDPSEPLSLFDLASPDWTVFEHLGEVARPDHGRARVHGREEGQARHRAAGRLG
ncbi:MAG: hypothetical protein IPO59_11360 [Betaproteobacteria bacterium]|nr:hypothetical protein [Betaproteobacteria bacterium]